MAPVPVICPQCGSKRVWKDGIRSIRNGEVQRWLCRDCGFRFSGAKQGPVPELKIKENIILQSVKKLDSRPDLAQIPVSHSGFSAKKTVNDSSFPFCEDVGSHESPQRSTIGKSINAFASTIVNTKYASRKKAKNLAEVVPLKDGLAGATAQTADAKGKIVEYSFRLLKQGFAESTIKGRVKLMKRLLRLGANLHDPESIKEIIAKQEWSASRKVNAVDAYTSFLQMQGKKWTPPIYRRVRKLPFIPTENELDQLISGCSRRMATFLQLLKETGMRCGEACQLKWTDMDLVNKSVRVTPEKGGNPRSLKMSNRLVSMLNAMPKDTSRVFNGNTDVMRRNFSRQRKRIVAKLKNPRINQITFHTFRHWKATMEYHKTKDILHVKEVLGHKSINNTLIYTQLVSFEEDEFTARVGHSEKEACELVEAGFQFVCDFNGNKIFRKPK